MSIYYLGFDTSHAVKHSKDTLFTVISCLFGCQQIIPSVSGTKRNQLLGDFSLCLHISLQLILSEIQSLDTKKPLAMNHSEVFYWRKNYLLSNLMVVVVVFAFR